MHLREITTSSGQLATNVDLAGKGDKWQDNLVLLLNVIVCLEIALELSDNGRECIEWLQ